MSERPHSSNNNNKPPNGGVGLSQTSEHGVQFMHPVSMDKVLSGSENGPGEPSFRKPRFGAALTPSTDPNGRDANRGWEYSPVLGNATFMAAADALAQAARAAAASGVAEHVARTNEALMTVQFIALVRCLAPAIWRENRLGI